MFVKSRLQEIGRPIDVIKLRTDSNAFIGFSEKPGLGTMKHIEIKKLVIQEAVRSGLLKLEKEPTASNKADLMTKWLSPERVTYLMNLGNCFYIPRRGEHQSEQHQYQEDQQGCTDCHHVFTHEAG